MNVEQMKVKESEIYELNQKLQALKMSDNTKHSSDNVQHSIVKKSLVSLPLVSNPTLQASKESVERGERPALEVTM